MSEFRCYQSQKIKIILIITYGQARDIYIGIYD